MSRLLCSRSRGNSLRSLSDLDVTAARSTPADVAAVARNGETTPRAPTPDEIPMTCQCSESGVRYTRSRVRSQSGRAERPFLRSCPSTSTTKGDPMNMLSKRWLLGSGHARRRRCRDRRSYGYSGIRRLDRDPRIREGTRSADRASAARSPDRGKRHPGRSDEGVGAPAALQGQGRREDRVVRPARRFRLRGSPTTSASTTRRS